MMQLNFILPFCHLLISPHQSYALVRNGETRKKTVQVLWQGIWFILAYMAALIPAIVTLVVRDYPKAYAIFVACINPLQGAFNTFVYFRPKYKAERQKMVSGSGRRKSRLSSVLKTLNVTLPRRSSVSLPIPPDHDNDGLEKSCQKIMETYSCSKKDELEEIRNHL